MKFKMATPDETISTASLVARFELLASQALVGDVLLLSFLKELGSRPVTILSGTDRFQILSRYCDWAEAFPRLGLYPPQPSYASRSLPLLRSLLVGSDNTKNNQKEENTKTFFDVLLLTSASKIWIRLARLMVDLNLRRQQHPFDVLLDLNNIIATPPISIRLDGPYTDELIEDCQWWEADFRVTLVILKQVHADFMRHFHGTYSPQQVKLSLRMQNFSVLRETPLFVGLPSFRSIHVAQAQGKFTQSLSSWLSGTAELGEFAERMRKRPEEVAENINTIFEGVPLLRLGNRMADGLTKFGEMVSAICAKVGEAVSSLIPILVSLVTGYYHCFTSSVGRFLLNAVLAIGAAFSIPSLTALIPASVMSWFTTSVNEETPESLFADSYSEEFDSDSDGGDPSDRAWFLRRNPDPSARSPRFAWRHSESVGASGGGKRVPFSYGAEPDDDEIFTASTQGVTPDLIFQVGKRLIAFFVANGFRFSLDVEKTLRGLPSAVRGIDELLKIFVSMVSMVGEYLLPGFVIDYITGAYAGVEVKEWFDECHSIFLRQINGELIIDRALPVHLKELVSMGEQFVVKSKAMGIDSLVPLMTNMVLKLKKLDVDIAPLCTELSIVRPKPVVVLMRGKSGSGKSNLTTKLALELAYMEASSSPQRLAAFEAQYRNELFYQGPDHFHDGMTSHQPVYVYDDWYQENPAHGSENPPGATFIRMANEVPFTPRMANVELKNNVYANFQYMLFTTNMEKIDDPTTLCKEAIGNRIDFIIRCERNAKAKTAGKVFDPNVYTLHVEKYAGGESGVFEDTGEVISPEILLERITTKAADNRQYWMRSLEVKPGKTFGKWKEDPRLAQYREFCNAKGNGKIPVQEDAPPPEPPKAQWNSALYAQAVQKTAQLLGELPFQDALEEPDLDMTLPPGAFVAEVQMFGRSIFGRKRAGTGVFGEAIAWVEARYGSNHYELEGGPTGSMSLAVSYDMENASRETIWRNVFGNAVPDNVREVFFSKFGEEIAGLSPGALYLLLTKRHFQVLEECGTLRPDRSAEALAWVNSQVEAFAQAYPNAYSAPMRALRWLWRETFGDPVLMTMIKSIVLGSLAIMGMGELIKFRLAPKRNKGLGSVVPPGKKTFGGAEAQTPGLTSNAHLRDRKERKKRDNKNTRQAMHDLKVLQQGRSAETQGMTSDIVNLVRKNQLELWMEDDLGMRFQGYVLAVGGRIFTMPQHYITCFVHHHMFVKTPPEKVFFEMRQEGYPTITVRMQDDLQVLYDGTDERSERFVFTVRSKCREFKDLTRHMIPYGDVVSALTSATREFTATLVFPREIRTVSDGFAAGFVFLADIGEWITDQFGYRLDTIKGDCGVPVILTSGKFAGKIVAFHVAGDGTLGFAQPISRTMFVKALGSGIPSYEDEVPDIVINPDPILAHARLDFHDGVATTYITRHLEPPGGVHVQNSLVHFEGDGPEYFERKTAATSTSPRLYAQNRAAFGESKVEVDWELIDRIVPVITQHFKRCARHIVLRPYSFKEALLGLEDGLLNGMETTTSPGYPDSSFGVVRKDYWKVDERGRFLKGPRFEELRSVVEAEINLLVKGGVPRWVMKDIMKGERVKIQKVESGKVRLVNAPPVSMHVICTMAFGAAIEVLMAGSPRNGILKGINEKNAREWDVLTRLIKTKSNGQYVGSGDFKAFDHSHSCRMMQTALRGLSDMYPHDPVWTPVREGIGKWFECQFHVFGSVLEVVSHGMPSGFRLTTEANCFINFILHLYAWCELHSWKPNCEHNFFDNVYLSVIGDDSIFSVSERFKNLYTESFLSQVFDTLGYTYTAPDKGPARETLSELTNHSVVKRGFRFEPVLGCYVAPLELDVVLEMPLWSRKGMLYEKIGIDNMNSALRELSLHGREVYEEWMPKMRLFAGRFWRPFSESWLSTLRMVAESQGSGKSANPEALGLKGRLLVYPTTFLDHKGPNDNYNQTIYEASSQAIFMSANTNDVPMSMGLSGPNEIREVSSVRNEGTTAFNDDTAGPVSQPVYSFESSKFIRGSEFRGSDDILEFLRRPTILTSGSFSTTDSGALWTVDPFYALVSGAKAPKLAGVYGIRATVRIIIQVNAVRFQTGRYMVGFVPSGGFPATDASYAASYRMHATTLTNATQCPHVEIDLATQTHAELVIPWDCVYPYFVNESTYPVGIGLIFLRPYAALSSASGDTTCGYVVYGSLEDVTLTGVAYTQSKLSFSEQEAKKAGIGPVEGALTKISQVSSILGEIPFMAPATSVVSWSAGVLARAAHVFGWSKPIVRGTTTPVASFPYRYLANSDGDAMTTVLGGVSSNSLVSYPRLGGTKADEMSFDFLKSVYSYVFSITWTASSASGTLLSSWGVRPGAHIVTVGSGSVLSTPAFLQSFFALWRGSLKYRFKLVKNEFYSGRILVSFSPYYHGTANISSLAATEFTQRVVIDVRETSEFEIVIPYISPEAYTSSGTPIGTVNVFVLDSLVVPNTCPSAITMLVEIAGGEDLQFAYPYPSSYEPWIPVTTQSRFVAHTQSAYQSCGTHYLGKAGAVDHIDSASVAAGEKFESLRQLAKMFWKDVLTTGDFLGVNSGSWGYVRPFSHVVVSQATSNTTPVNRGIMYGNVIDQIACCYAIVTGCSRVVAHPTTSNTTIQFGLINEGSGSALVGQFGQADVWDSAVRGFISRSDGAPCDFVIPPYERSIGRPTAANLLTDGAPTVYSSRSNATALLVVDRALSGSSSFMIGRMASDDWNAYHFVSVPSLILRTQS